MTSTNPWLRSPDVAEEVDDDATPDLAVAPTPAIAGVGATGRGCVAPGRRRSFLTPAASTRRRRIVDRLVGRCAWRRRREHARAAARRFARQRPRVALRRARHGPHAIGAARRSHATLAAFAPRSCWRWSGRRAVSRSSLHGLVLIADAPGKLPKPLKDFAQVVSGAVPRVWHLPWVEAWRLGEPVSGDTTPKAIVKVLDELRGLHHIPPSPFP